MMTCPTPALTCEGDSEAIIGVDDELVVVGAALDAELGGADAFAPPPQAQSSAASKVTTTRPASVLRAMNFPCMREDCDALRVQDQSFQGYWLNERKTFRSYTWP